jgi:thiamine-monophosphate kinase
MTRDGAGCDAAPSVAQLGEFGLIARVTSGRVQPASTLLGPGDDAALVAASDGRVAASTDMLVEGVHFRLDWSTPEQVGRKAAAVNMADVAAMGAVPTALLVGLGCPGDTPALVADGLVAGLWAEATAQGAGVVGGDVVSAPSVVISVTVLGDLHGRSPVTRAGARPGDVLAVAGRLGWAAAGLAVLGQGLRSPVEVVQAHRVPLPRQGLPR